MNIMKKIFFTLLLCCGCVPVPSGAPAEDPGRAAVASPYRGLDPGYKSEETAHFALNMYSSANTALYPAMCEADYTRIMQDLGLYSFVPARPYNVVIYRDAQEYRTKTGQPDWSGGATYGNALLLFEGDGLKASMSHEMTHLVFNEFMGLSQSAELRWLNEGVAVYEETRSNQVSASYYTALTAETIAPNPIPFSQMVNLAPQNESRHNVDRWYTQVGSVAGFMIRRGGSFNFSVFLSKLRDGASMDSAIAGAYTGSWKKLSDVENSWLLDVKR